MGVAATPQLGLVIVAGLLMVPGVALLWNVNLDRDAPLTGVPSYVNSGWYLGTRDWNIRAVQFEVFCVFLIWLFALGAAIFSTKRGAMLCQAIIAGLMLYMFVVGNTTNWNASNTLRIWRDRVFPWLHISFPAKLEKALAGTVLVYLASILSTISTFFIGANRENLKQRSPYFGLVLVFVIIGSIVMWTSKLDNYGQNYSTPQPASTVNRDTMMPVIIVLALAGAAYGGSSVFAGSAITLVGIGGFFFLTRMFLALYIRDLAQPTEDTDQLKAGYVIDWLSMIFTLFCGIYILHHPATA